MGQSARLIDILNNSGFSDKNHRTSLKKIDPVPSGFCNLPMCEKIPSFTRYHFNGNVTRGSYIFLFICEDSTSLVDIFKHMIDCILLFSQRKQEGYKAKFCNSITKYVIIREAALCISQNKGPMSGLLSRIYVKTQDD